MADGRKQSFSSCCRATQIKTYSWDNAQVILVGNKCDMEDERIIPLEKGKHLADQLGMCYIFSFYCFSPLFLQAVFLLICTIKKKILFSNDTFYSGITTKMINVF